MSGPEKHTLTSVSGEFTRDVWVLDGPTDQAHPLCLFLDAELYLNNMQAAPILTGLMQSGALPPMTCVFVSHVNGAARHADYTWSESYTKFIGEDVVTWARARNAEIQAADNLICGLSLSALAGAYVALCYPQIFSYALCQSGSFWWLHGKEFTLPRTKSKFWLSVGDKETSTNVSHPPSGLYQEISQIAGVEAMVMRLQNLGATVKHHPYHGAHAIEPWREELGPALQWLVNYNASKGVYP